MRDKWWIGVILLLAVACWNPVEPPEVVDEHIQIVVPNGLAVDVQSEFIYAEDFVTAIHGDNPPYSYEIIYDFNDWWLPELPITCDDLGTKILWVRVLGADHSSAPVNTYVIVGDHENVCGEDGP